MKEEERFGTRDEMVRTLKGESSHRGRAKAATHVGLFAFNETSLLLSDNYVGTMTTEIEEGNEERSGESGISRSPAAARASRTSSFFVRPPFGMRVRVVVNLELISNS